MKTLICPADIAVQPERFDVVVGEYDFTTQTTIGLTSDLAEMATSTFGGTRTYNMQGQPNDSDMDHD